MSSKRKGLRYSQKRLDYKREESANLRMKVLRSVLAVGVGFALTPWLGRDAYAESNGIVRTGNGQTNLIGANGSLAHVANIYAADAYNGVGVNAFKHFELGNNQIANLYFKTSPTDTNVLNTLVNTVENRISISGTVNAIRNNKIGGNLYFLSPKGMVVGSTGVINAGSLTVMTSGNTFGSAKAAAQAITDKSWGGLDSNASIDIHGKINTATGIDLRAAYINVNKASGSDIAPALKTGVVFANTVNTIEIDKQAGNVISGSRLAASLDDKGNIVIADPSNPTGAQGDAAVKGDGSIKIAASASSNNTSSNFLGLHATDTVKAEATVGEGATIDAVGNVSITADAKRENTNYIVDFWDLVAFTKANVTVDGNVSGGDVKIAAIATSTYAENNYKNLPDVLNTALGESGWNFDASFTSYWWGELLNNGVIPQGATTIENIVNQFYMPFGVVDAQATTNVGSKAIIKANLLKDASGNVLKYYDAEAKKDVMLGGNLDINAKSTAKNSMGINLQLKYQKGTIKDAKLFLGGFIYEDSTSKAKVNMSGWANAEQKLAIKADAKNTNKGKLSVKKPSEYGKSDQDSDSDGAGFFMAALGMAFQETEATVNLNQGDSSIFAPGTALDSQLTAGGKLQITAKTVNSVDVDAAVETSDTSVVSTAVTVVGSKNTTTVNDYISMKGGSMDISAEQEMEDLSACAGNDIDGEYEGLDWALDKAKQCDKLGQLLGYVGQNNQNAANNNNNNQNNVQIGNQNGQAGQGDPSWNEYFSLGAGVTVVNVTNNVTTNIEPNVSITATKGDVNIGSKLVIDDSWIGAFSSLVNTGDNTTATVSAAVAVENVHNTAETNVKNNVNLQATKGNITVTAAAEQEYNRLDQMVADLEDGLKSFLEQFKGDDVAKRIASRVQSIITDVHTLQKEDKATSIKKSKLFTKKAKATINLLTELTGTTDLYKALLAFTDASNYANMAVSAYSKNDNDSGNDVTAVATGSVGVQNLHNTANVNIGANTQIKAVEYDAAGAAVNYGGVNIAADVKEGNVLGIGKWVLIPDPITTGGAKNGLGGSVAVQNAYNNSKVQIMNGVNIDAGAVDVGTNNDVFNLGFVLGGAQTSQRGLTGMVSYMGGDSHAETLVDDDVSFTARKKVARVTEKDENDNDTQVDKITSSGAVNIAATNDTDAISIVGDIMNTGGSAIGVSTGVISYDIHTLAKLENQETTDTSGKGYITANSVNVNALTDGVINNITVAGNKNGTQNQNQQAGGVQANAGGGAGAAAQGGVQNQAINANNGGSQDVVARINAAGSVSWNYVVDETRAILDNVAISLTEPTIDQAVQDATLKSDKTTAVNVKAEDSSYIGAYSGAAALTKLGNNSQASFQAALSGAVAVNDLKKETYSTFKNSSVENADNIYNLAQNSGAQVAAGLSVGLETGYRKQGNNTISVNLGASGSANYINSTVHADMASDTLNGKNGGSMSVNNLAYDKDVQVAGGITAEYAKSSVALGAAVTVNSITNDIQATMSNMNIGSMGRMTANVENLALSKLTQVGTAVSVGVLTGNGKNYAVGKIAVANNTVHNTVKATISGGNIYAKTVASEARDGKLKENEADNKYLAEINAVPNSIEVDSEGNYVKDGQVLRYDEATGKYYDSNDQEVDVNASEDGHIFDLDGSDTQQFLRDADIGVNSNSDGSLNESGKYSHQSIAVTNQGNSIVGVALGLGIKTGEGGTPSGAGAVAVNVNNVDNTFAAAIENKANIIAGPSVTTTGSDGKSTTTPAVQVNALSDTKIVGVAAGVAANVSGGNNVNIGAAGSAVKQSIKNKTTATVADSTINTDNLSLDAETTSTLVSVAGQVSVATGENSIAAGLTWAENHLDNTTGVYAKGISLSGINSGAATNLFMSAENKSKTWAVAAGGSVSTGRAAAEGAYASNNGTNDIEAIVDKYETKNEQGVVTYSRNNTISNANNISITAKDNTVEKGIAGSIAVAAGKDTVASIGGAVVYNNIGNSATDKQTVKAQLNNAAITTVNNATLQVKAINDADFLGLALGGAVRASTDGNSPLGISAQGSVAVSTAYMDTIAGMENVKIDETSGSQTSKVEVEATSTSDITSSADALFVSAGKGGAQIAVGAAVSKVNSDADTKTEIKNSTIKARDFIAKANSTNKILDVAIGVGVGAGAGPAAASVAGNIAVNKIDNDTTVTFNNDDIYATGTVAALSDSYEQLRNYSGGISVAATSGQAAVALGATVVTNTIEGDTKSVVNNSSITALGAGDGVKVNKHSFDAITGSSSKYELKEQAATDTTAKKGLVVNAEAEHFLRDVSITGGVAVSTQAGVAVDATVVINKIAGTTSAEVNSTDVNKDATQLSTADVTVDAYDRADISSHIGTMSVGVALGEGAGVGAAGAGDRNTVNRTTTARILGKNDNSTVLNAHNVNVDALGYTSVYLSESGLAAGASALAGAGVTGSVSVDRFTSNTTALVSQVKGTVNDLIVNADRLANVEAYNNAIALSGGIFSGSVSVGVTDVEDTSHTNAELSKVELAAANNQSGKVKVQAENHTQLGTELSGDALAVSIGGAAGIAVGNINTEAQVGAKVDHAVIGTEEKEFGEFTVEANNNTYNRYQNIAVGVGSLLGVAVGKGAMNINTGTAAEVLNSSAFAKNINVNAFEKRTIDTDMVGVGVGALNVGVNVMYTNIGTNMQTKYKYDDGSKEYDNSDFATMVNNALARMNSQVDVVRTKTGDNSIEYSSSTINTGRADQGGIRNTIANSALKASDDLKVQAKATTNTDIDIKQASIAIVNIGVPANRTDVEDKLTIDIDNAALQGKAITVESITDGEIKSYTGQGGFSAGSYVDTTAYIKHHGTNTITIDGSTLRAVNAASTTVNPLSIHALNQTKINNSAFGLNYGGLVAGRVVLEGEDSTEVKIELSKDANVNNVNSFSASKIVNNEVVNADISVLTENRPLVKDEINAGVSVGGVAAGGSLVVSKASGKAILDVSNKNSFKGQSVALETNTSSQKKWDAATDKYIDEHTVEAINHAVGVTALSINVDKVRTFSNMEASTTVGAINIEDGAADVKIGATNATKSNAYIHSVRVGLGAASGSNFAQSHAEGKAITTVNAGAGGISANSFDIFASNSDDIIAKADGSNAGLMDISPYAARVENTVNTTTTVNLTGRFEAIGAFKAQALRKDIANFAADSLSVTAAGGGDARADSTITANTNLNATGATITSGSDMLLEAENTVEMNHRDGYAQMVKGQGYAIIGINTSGIGNTINSTAHVNLLNSNFTSGGNLKVIAHTEEQLQTNGYVYTASAYGGVKSVVTNTITNDELVKVENSELETTNVYKDITLSAADDLKLFTYAYSEFSSGAMGGADAIVNNNLTRNNKINLLSGSDLYGLQDINLYAGKNADGSVATLDLDAEATDFVGSDIPITIKPSVNNDIRQNNQITIDAASASTSVRHTNLYASTGREMARISSGRYVGIWSSKRDSKFVTTDKGETVDGKTANNYVDINGKVVAGIANKIDITIGSAGDIVILDEKMRDSVSGAKDASQITVKVDANASTGLSRNSLTFGSENYANTLYERYNAVLDLMNEYEKDGTDSAAYIGYKSEANRILQEMMSLGLAEQNAKGVIDPKASLIVDYVEIPDLVSSGGNIVVDTDTFKSTSGVGIVKAQGTPEINITNNTNLMTKVNSITVGDPGGKLIYNGTNVSGTNTGTFNKTISGINKGASANFKVVDAAAGQSGNVKIQGLYDGRSLSYSFVDNGERYTGTYRPMANIQVQGNIYSQEGAVTIKSAHDSILIQGKTAEDAVAVSGAQVNIIAENGSITQGYTDGIVNIGGDVRAQYNDQYQSIINTYGNSENTSSNKYNMTQVTTAPADDSKASGSYIAGGSVYINASDINVNGVIQSGFGEYYADISDAEVQANITKINNAYNGMAISDSVVTTGEQYKIIDGGAYWSAADGCYKYRLNVYYNPSTQKILVQNVEADGGKIYLTGRISSTGNGKIVCLDGVSSINVNNTTNYDLQVGDLITHDVAGLVSITDTAKQTLTEVTKGKVTVKAIDSNGKVATSGTTSSFTGSYSYAPKTGLRYSWTSGKEKTTFRRYKEDFKEGGWGMWNNGVEANTLATWMQENNPKPIESSLSKDDPRASGETIREGTTGGSYVTVSSKNIKDTLTKEGERKYSTGLWGINKHYEVTWTESTGTLYTYDASVQADKSFSISFIGNAADTNSINLTSTNNIELTGTVGNTALYETKVNNVVTGRNEKGTINVTSQNGSIIQSGGALYGANINLAAAKDMKDITIVAGDVVNLSAINNMANQNLIAQNSMDITVKGAYLAKGNVVLGNMGSVISNNGVNSVPVNDKNEKTTGATGLVEVSTEGSEGNITQKAGSLIVADRIDLNSANGSIYGQKQSNGSVSGLQLYAGQQPLGLDTLDASVNASAKGDIYLAQVDGNLRVGRIYSTEGDVTLTVSHGSVEDALPYVSSDRGDADDMLARWKRLGVVADSTDAENAAMLAAKTHQNQGAKQGAYEAWDTYALLYAIQDSIVNPETSALPSTSDKDPNIIGHNITINVADSVGMNSGIEKRIDVNTLLAKDSSGNYTNLQDLQALSKLDASTKVTWEKGSNGHTYAVYTETIPLGIQQTVQKDANGKDVYGKLTIQSAANSTNLNGDIFLQGREQKLDANGLASAITNNKNLYINNIWTTIGEITVTSLGSIYNVAGAGATAITGKNLVLTAANGSIGTAANHITTNLLGADKNVDGLSAIATGGIYVDQKASNGLIVRNVSSGGDIYLGSDKGILMGFVNGSDADSYIRAENNGDIVLEARGGSIGDVEYEKDAQGNYVLDAQGNKIVARDTNNGVRILNAASKSASASDEKVTNITLRASDSVYVTGVASRDGKTAAAQGPAGVLNLTVEGENASGSALTLNNVGIYVDGALNLENTVQASKTASVYVTDDLNLGTSNKFGISAPDIFMGSAKTVTLAGVQSIAGGEKLTVQAGLDLYMNSGTLSSNNLSLAAARNVYLNGGSLNTAANVNVHAGNNLTQAGTAITAHNSANTANAQLTADNKMYLNRGSLNADEAVLTANNAKNESGASLVEATSNYKLSTNTMTIAAKGATLDSRLNQLHNVFVDKNSSGNIVLGNGNTTNADLNVSLGNASAGSKLNGSLTVHNYASGAANKLVVDKLLGATGEINLINDETDINVASGAAITANNVLLQAKSNAVSVTGGSVAAASRLTLDAANVNLTSGALQAATAVATASKDIAMTGGSMNATTATMTAGNNINLTNGALQANTASLVARNGNITEAASGYVLDVANLTATAKSNITLDSSANQLEKVSVANTAGNVAIGSGNSQNANALAVTTNGQIKGNLSIINYADSSSYNNAIVFDNNLKATENITITNQEAGINVNKNAAIEGANVALTASTSANITGGTISTGSMDIYANNASISGGNISTDDMDVYANNANISGGTISADDMDIEANNATISGGSIKAKAIDIDANNNATISGGNVEANIIDVAAQNAMINGGTVKGANIHVNAIENVNVNGGQMQGTDIAWNAINVTVGGGSVQATNLNVAVNNNLQLNGGNLTADVARLTSEGGTIKQQYDAKQTTNKGTVYAKDLYITTKAAAADGLTVDLGNRYNKFSNIYITDATKGELSLGSSNDAAGALKVSVLNGTSGTGMLQGSLTVHNYANGAANKLLVNDNLTATGTITLINDEANIEIADDGVGTAANLQAHKITLDSNYDIIHRSGTIVAVEGNGSAASGKIDLDADGSILLLGGSMSATNVDMLAIDHIYEKYDNNAQGTAASGYALTVNGTLTVLTTGGSTVDYGIDLGSRYNQLHRVIMDSDKGNIILGNGGSQNLEVEVESGNQVQGSIVIHNYAGGSPNDIVVVKDLKARDNIDLINDERDIIITRDNASVVEATNVILEAQLSIINEATIAAKNDATLYAHGVTLKADDEAIYNIGDINAAGEINHATDAGAIYNTGTMQGTKGVVMLTNKDNNETTGNIINSGHILTDRNAIIDSWGDLKNTGNIKAGGYVDLDASGDVVNGDAASSITGQIIAGREVYLTSWKGNVTNYDNIQSINGEVVLENGYVYTLDDNNNTTLVNNIINTGSIMAKEDVLLRTFNGSIDNEAIIESEAASVTIEALKSKQCTGTSANEIGVIRNTGDAGSGNNADIMAAQNITLNAAASIINLGDFYANRGNIQVNAGDTILNTGNYGIKEMGDITVISNGGDVLNMGHYYTKSGAIHMEAQDDLVNMGVMESEKGDINLTSLNGSLYNEAGADLLAGDGDITLSAKSNKAGYYYTVYNEQNKSIDEVYVAEGTPIYDYDDFGGKYIIANGEKQDVVKNGSVFNAGDAMAINGTIRIISEYGDVTNYDDFNTLLNANGDESEFYKTASNPNGIDIATGNVELLAAHGTLYNTKDLESGQNITLMAAKGLTNFAYNVYAGKNISLTATEGDVLNTATLESYAGDVTLQAYDGNVINGAETGLNPGKGDIITYGGNVTLLAQGSGSVTNYGDIIAINANATDKVNSGSITLKSEHHDVDNFDDFNTYRIGDNYYKDYKAIDHGSIESNDASYNLANNNLTISAREGHVFNNKDYLVALGNVELEVKTGLSSFGQAIYAGKNITMTATEGDLFNKAELLSVEGDITLKAEKGTVVNLIGGDMIARNGNVTLEAGAEANNTIRYVDAMGNAYELHATQGQAAGDSIVITKQFYKDTDRKWVEMVKTNDKEVVAPASATEFQTEIWYLQDYDAETGKKNEPKLVTTITGDKIGGLVEAYRTGDVVNRGDIIAQGSAELDKGAVTLHSAKGNTTNYDNFKLFNGKDNYDYLGETGSEHQTKVGDQIQTIKVKFNPGTAYYYDAKGILLSDSDMNLIADKGYLYNNMNIISEKSVNLTSGKTLTIGTNVASVIAKGDVLARSNYGYVINDSHIESKENSIVLDGEIGVTSQVGAANLSALNGSISAVTTYGQIDIDELIAGQTAAAGVKEAGSVKIGDIKGKDVVLYTENADATITIEKSITVEDHLLLQGNSFDLPKIQRTNLDGTLIVDVNGVGAGNGSAAMKGNLNLTIDGDVRFTTMNVTNANVSIGGTMSIDKLHVGGEAHFESQGYVTGVYGGGTTPYHDSSNALYYDLGTGSGDGAGMRVSAEEFRAIKEGTPETVRALATMKSLKERFNQLGIAPDTFNKDNSGWMNLYVDTSNYQRSNGLLLHIDTGYRSANQRWSAEDLSTKLVAFTAHEAFTTNYGDVAGSFGRYDLLEVADRPMGEILHTANENKVVLQKDNSSLRIEEKQEEKE